MAKSSAAKKVYLPHDLTIQLGPTQENPDGKVVQLHQGMVDLSDQDIANHPVIQRLVSVPGDSARDTVLAEATTKRDEAINAALAEYSEAVAKAETARREEINKASEEWAKRAEAARESGVGFTEPHPDPATAKAFALTAQPNQIPVGGNLSMSSEDYENMPKNESAKTQQRPRLHDQPAGEHGNHRPPS